MTSGRDLLAAFIAMMLRNQAGAQVPDFEFKDFRTSSASSSEYRPCGTPSESSTSECRSCGIPSESDIRECGSYGIPSESCTSTPFGLICIKDVGIQGRVNPMAGMQMLPTGLLSCEESMVFIVDSGASRTLTFEERDFVPGTLKLYMKPPVLTGVRGTLEIKGEGAIQFQVVMDGCECEGNYHSSLLDPRDEV